MKEDNSVPPRLPFHKRPVTCVGFLLACILLSLAGCFALMSNGSDGVRFAPHQGDNFLNVAEGGDTVALRALMIANADRKAIQKLLRDTTARRGKMLRHDKAAISFPKPKAAYSAYQVRLTYQETFADKSTAPVELVMLREKGEWKVLTCRFP